MARKVPLTEGLREEYQHLYSVAKVRQNRLSVVDATVDKIFSPENYKQYKAVEAGTGVPAYIVGIIHNLEASGNFNKHLHNGDPLSARTVRVPAGHPKAGTPPFTWEFSAVDALLLKKSDQWIDWSIAGIAYFLEGYNGFGYRLYHPHVKSPYLWSFTTVYTAGKYVEDGKWSETAVSQQCGGMALLKRMVDRRLIDLPTPQETQDQGEVAMVPFLDAAEVSQVATGVAPYPGKALKRGDQGADVVALQARLHIVGVAEVGIADGDFGAKTEIAVKLFQARAVDHAGAPLKADGVVGRLTWAALFDDVPSISFDDTFTAPPGGSLAEAVIRIASEQVGVRETPPGSNRGRMVDEYMKSVDPSQLGKAWCVAFVYWCFNEAANRLGVKNPLPKTAGVLKSWAQSQSLPGVKIVTAQDAAGDSTLIEPGMVFYMDSGGGYGHAGIVVSVLGSVLTTIEGNTNAAGSRTGGGVFQRTARRVENVNVGFIGFG